MCLWSRHDAALTHAHARAQISSGSMVATLLDAAKPAPVSSSISSGTGRAGGSPLADAVFRGALATFLHVPVPARRARGDWAAGGGAEGLSGKPLIPRPPTCKPPTPSSDCTLMPTTPGATTCRRGEVGGTT
eukprot:CAMPEP_0205942838 /NCGR_PEP_ID=MMETSP1325-20131115/58805_1 /ASSEMBLY_ACC=CAM_ASM_000708 /TAXON_ID=236786 /ORGANISM="Florenciella sp., Strain RCC1007" /LENGTH=131 /DNA_ID=CAMNT_0053313601 /DNA_START=151 /DNA_END=543 /DNA_ORIENTATION=-